MNILQQVKGLLNELKQGLVAPAEDHPKAIEAMVGEIAAYNAMAGAAGVVSIVGGLVAGAGVVKAVGIGCLVAMAGSMGAGAYVAVKNSVLIGREIIALKKG